MKQAKNVPQLRFSAFDDEWEEKKLNNYLEVSTEKNFDNLFTKENVLSVSGEFGVVNQIAFQGRSFAGASLTNYKISDLESVIYTKSPLNATPYGIIKANKFEKGIVSVLYAVYKTNNSDSKFIQDYFNLDERLNNYLRPLISKGAKNTINVSDLEALEGIVTFPSLSEQQKIGTFLSHVDSLIQAKTKKLESLKAVKKSLLQKCFPKAGEKVPEMRFAGFSGDWEEKKLGEIANIYDGTHQTPKYQSTGVKFLSVENIKNLETDKYISTADFVKDFKIYPQKGDILMTRIGDIGTTNIYLSTEPIAFYVSLALLKPTNIDSLFLNYVIQSPFVQNELSLHTLHTAIPKKINKNEISLVKLLVPSSKSEQQKIGQFFSKYDSLISAQQKELDKLKDIKKSLLQKMFV